MLDIVGTAKVMVVVTVQRVARGVQWTEWKCSICKLWGRNVRRTNGMWKLARGFW